MTEAGRPPFDDAALTALARDFGERLRARGETAATAESCTGGWIAKVLTDVPGSSAWFGYGLVTYADDAKQRLLGVDAGMLARHGAVSRAVVCAMVRGALALSGADHAVAVSGVAGPDGGSPEKPVGTVWFAWASAGGGPAVSERLVLPGGRDAVRRATVVHALSRWSTLLEDAPDVSG